MDVLTESEYMCHEIKRMNNQVQNLVEAGLALCAKLTGEHVDCDE